MKYLDLINRTAEETAKSNNALIAKESAISMQRAMLDIEKEISSLENNIENTKCSKPLDVNHLMELSIKLDIAKKKLTCLTEFQKELF